MMLEETLRIRFLSEWHCGSGLGESHLADAVLNRDSSGLPVITGRAVKGALREGAWRLVAAGFAGEAERVFGSPCDADAPRSGLIAAGTAVLPDDVRGWLLSAADPAERAARVSLMVTRRASTAMKDGVAADHSLRTMECGMPGLEFVCTVSLDVPDAEKAWYRGYMRAVCAAVKSMGAGRARGLGRCVITFGSGAGAAKLPPVRGEGRKA